MFRLIYGGSFRSVGVVTMDTAFEKLEFPKILSAAANYAVLERGKELTMSTLPADSLAEANASLALTDECARLLFDFGVGKIEYFLPFGDEFERAAKGATLSCAQLMNVGSLLRSSRILDRAVSSVKDDGIVSFRRLLAGLYIDLGLEDDIRTKIVNESEVSDYASDKLYSIRMEIRRLNERIRAKLSEYLSGENAKYLQEGIITMRGDRYVLPVKAEYKRSVRGFVHDRSQSGATLFIEPEYVLEMNNELITLTIDEREEVERILAMLSRRVGQCAAALSRNIEILGEADACFARAEYGYRLRAIKPVLNGKGIVKIREGRHPLIDAGSVVPVSVELGDKFRFLLVSGPNTGGKTVTLKMVGLFCLMAASGFYVPAAEGTTLAVFDRVFCDIGDAQSIEESLSTFSSHMTNIISIVREAGEWSLVLIDELGGGTDPEEGQALAKAVIAHLMDAGCRGIVTTHYTSLKEFAFRKEGLENASMAFDAESLRPLYRIQIGLPGSSNALSICRRLGLDESILSDAYENLSQDAKALTNILKSAEESRLAAQESLARTRELEKEWGEKISLLDDEREKLRKEREKLFLTAKAEAKRIVNEKVAEAEELVGEMEKIFAKEELSQADLIRARTLKNKVAATSYEREEEAVSPQYTAFEGGREGETVFVRSVGREGKLLSVNDKRKETEVQCGEMRLRCKFSDLMSISAPAVKKAPKKQEKKKSDVTLVRKFSAPRAPALELNVLGMTVSEAIPEVDAFIDQAVVSNIEEIKIIHGVGTGKLKAGIHDHLRHHKNVEEFRLGKYGEGETGVTFVKIK